MAVLNRATSIPSKKREQDNKILRERKKEQLSGDDDTVFYPSWKNIARGLLPSLRHVLGEEIAPERDTVTKTASTDCSLRHMGDYGAMEPHGNDYYCVVCQCEMPNLYYSCNGCEKLLDKDYKICARCLGNERFNESRVMGLDKTCKDVNKINFKPLRHHCVPALLSKKRFAFPGGCKKSTCLNGKFCNTCARVLHTTFTEHRRFHTLERLKECVQNCEDWVEDDVVPFGDETEKRLRRQSLPIQRY